jgi:drug/metabolite transporter (DMT)-like permease
VGLTARWIGPVFAIGGVFGFSTKAILVKLAYSWYPVDAVTLLTLRMLYSAPFFVAMAWWAGRRPSAKPIARNDKWRLLLLGCIGYYLSSLLDFMGLAYITASLERLILYLYPTFVVLLSAMLLGKPITRLAMLALALSYGGIVLVFVSDLRVTGTPGALWLGGSLVFMCSLLYAFYLVFSGGTIQRLGSARFIAWAMLVSTACIALHFLATRDLGLLRTPISIQLLALAMAVFSTVLPTWLIAESIRQIGANASALIGSLGPVFTIGLSAWLLAEPITAIQLAGAALVLAGVMLVTLRATRR